MVIMVDMVGYGSTTMEQSRFCYGVMSIFKTCG